MSQRAPRPWLGTALPVLAVFLVLIGLGTWQVQRLRWKTALIAHMEEGLVAAPVALPTEDLAGLDYRRVEVSGTFLHQHELHLLARAVGGRPGRHIVTPLRRTDGPIVLIDRGWVPEDRADPATRIAGQIGGIVTVEGIARRPAAGGYFMPDNDPARNRWYWIDLAAAERTLRLPLQPVVVEAGPAPNPGGYPVGGQTIIARDNPHLGYALTWYGLAAALAVIYVVWQRRRPAPGGAADGSLR
ncbi:MAG: SURF1 family protein [Alphaproteobacteria bacterium]|nr:SURF1 family protein [Alphaproteobacteria bacterium]